jgi:uncharacterized membrane protein
MAYAIPPSPTGSETGLPSNVAAGLCAFIPLVGGMTFYFIETKDLFVRRWAVQSIYFGAAWIAAALVIWILFGILSSLPGIGFLFSFLHFFLGSIVQFAGVVLWAIGTVKAVQHQKWEYPVISNLGKKYLPNLS